MATLQHNVTTETTYELLAVGSGVDVSSILLTNKHDSFDVLVDLYLQSSCSTNKYYMLYQHKMEKGQTIVLDHLNVKFNNRDGGFGLFIKLNETYSAVDVLIR
jgi:hypothetical protein